MGRFEKNIELKERYIPNEFKDMLTPEQYQENIVSKVLDGWKVVNFNKDDYKLEMQQQGEFFLILKKFFLHQVPKITHRIFYHLCKFLIILFYTHNDGKEVY